MISPYMVKIMVKDADCIQNLQITLFVGNLGEKLLVTHESYENVVSVRLFENEITLHEVEILMNNSNS